MVLSPDKKQVKKERAERPEADGAPSNGPGNGEPVA
jgi:hypothetical protein